MRAILLISALCLLSACAGQHGAPQAEGQWRVLNPGQWDFNPALASVPELPKITESN